MSSADIPPEDAIGSAPVEPKVFRWISVVEHALGAVLVVIIFLLVFIQALQRYLPFAGWTWSGELARYSLVALTFIMCGYLMGKGLHITIHVIDRFSSPKARRGIKILANVIVTVICVGFIREGLALAGESTGQVSAAMRMPLTFLYLIPLLGFILMALRSVYAIFRPESEGDGDVAAIEGETA